MARRGGCLINGCLTVLVLALVVVIGVMAWIGTRGWRYENQARDDLKASVDRTRAALARAAADGILLGTEIDRAVVGFTKSRPEVRRQARTVTVTMRLSASVGAWFVGAGDAAGCYRFETVPSAGSPSVSVREVPERTCLDRSPWPDRKPAEVADDVVVELRAAVARDGVEGAGTAHVWQTSGIRIEDRETVSGQLTTLAWLHGGTGFGSKVCYEFRVTQSSVTAELLKPDGCYRIERERYAQAEKARRAELEAGAENVERRMEDALDDGRLTDAEMQVALALPTPDGMGGETTGAPVDRLESVERSPTEVTVVARVQTVGAMWCYEFRAHLPTEAVTRHYLENGCSL
ncbi:hypothetical protein G5C60_01340 [Streptomyces sp. HC44]|uniref:Uncharacterized protein n=1 Tax=Streptomyces scabichelini TaxID=2711217 RepID=A0A6G4UX92_9ACTN|nr:hypothetical protein [Streptomyces scabichelini]NGO06359.1 hypothetical protein [Streptomyces scabichelini]